MATAEQIEQLKLVPIDFDKFAIQNSFFKKQYKLTTKNPFKTMSDEDWKIYVETHEPHFTSEPYYELIPWKELQQLEIDAKDAGWELILRTTNNTAYCPGYVGQNWCQRTQWIFGLPNMQLLIHLTYNEDIWSLVKAEDNNDIPLKNYFSLDVITTTKLKVREKTEEELDADYYDYDYDYDYDYYHNNQSNYSTSLEYYYKLKPANGWASNSGMSEGGTSQFEYLFVGSNAKYNSFLGCYTSTENQGVVGGNDSKESQKEETNILEKMIKPTFWIEWIENNKADIEPGKFSKIQITHWSDTYVLPGGQFNIDEVLQWDMDFRFLQQFMKSNICNWITRVFGYECCGTIGHNFWNIKIMEPLSNNPELFKKTCVIEAKKSADSVDEWKPFDGYKESLFQYKYIRLSENAKNLIKQVWEYVYLQNQ